MGNKTSTKVNKPSNLIPNHVVKQLNDSIIDQKYIDMAVAENQANISQPFIIILSTKQRNVMLSKLQDANTNIAVVHGTEHRYIRRDIANTIKQKFTDQKYNGIILILLCITSGNQYHSLCAPKFYYDQKQEQRNTNLLREDILLRLDDTKIIVDFNKCVRFKFDNNEYVSHATRFRSAHDHDMSTQNTSITPQEPKQQQHPIIKHDDYKHSIALKRIKHIVKQAKDDTFNFDAVDVQLQQISNAFLDLYSFDDSKLLQSLYVELAAECSNQCRILRRNAEIHSSATQQILDKIHCFFAHNYDMGKLTPDEQKMISEAASNEIKSDDEHMHLKPDYFKNAKKIKMLEILASTSKRNIFNTMETTKNRMQKYNHIINSNHAKNKMFQFGVKFHYKTETKCAENEIELKPKFVDIGEELVDNKIESLSIGQYKEEYKKAEILFKSDYNKRTYGNIGNGIMSIQHILSVMIYCNFTTLQHAFTKTYWNPKDHASFYNLGLWLKRSVHEFGQILDSQELNQFYHGLSEQLIFPAFINNVQIHCPLSTSSSLDVAINFTNFSGLLVEFCRANVVSGEVRQFPCWWVSDYAHENEHLFIQNESPLQISNILDAAIGYEYHPILTVLRIIDSILNGIPSIDSSQRVLTRRILEHQLSQSSHKYKPWKALNNYAKNILNTYFKNKKKLTVNCKSIESYRFLHEEFLIPKPTIWINISLIIMIVANCEHIIVENVCLSSAMIEDILLHLKDWKISTIDIDYVNKEFDISSAISKYKTQFSDPYNFQLIKRESDKYANRLCIEKMNNSDNDSEQSVKLSDSMKSSECSGTEFGLINGPIAIRRWFENAVCLLQEDTEKYIDLFMKNGYETMGAVQCITGDDLKCMGITKRGHIGKILYEVYKLKSVV